MIYSHLLKIIITTLFLLHSVNSNRYSLFNSYPRQQQQHQKQQRLQESQNNLVSLDGDTSKYIKTKKPNTVYRYTPITSTRSVVNRR